MTKNEIKDYLDRLHHHSFRNEKQIKNSRVCGCFYCGNIFKPEEIFEWWEDDGRGNPTAVCRNAVWMQSLGMIVERKLLILSLN